MAIYHMGHRIRWDDAKWWWYITWHIGPDEMTPSDGNVSHGT